MAALTKQQIVDHLVEQKIAHKHDSRSLVADFFEVIKCALEAGEEVKLSRFGNFKVIDKNSRPGRNPKTGEEVTVEARRVVAFSGSSILKERVVDVNKD